MKKYRVLSIVLIATLLAVGVSAFVGCDTTDTSVEIVNGLTIANIQNAPRMLLSAVRTTSTTSYASDVVTLTATVLPEYAVNKKVTWSVAWKDASSTWANGKDVNDYVELIPAEDGGLTATIAALKSFGEQVIVTVTSQANSSAKATCTVDYMKRLAAAANWIILKSAAPIVTSSTIRSDGTVMTVLPLVDPTSTGVSSDVYYNNIAFTFKPDCEGVYSKEWTETPEITSNISVSSELTTALNAVRLGTGSVKEFDDTITFGELYKAVCGDSSLSDSGRAYANQAIANATGSYDFSIIVRVSVNDQSVRYTFRCQFDRSNSALNVQSLSVEDAEVVL